MLISASAVALQLRKRAKQTSVLLELLEPVEDKGPAGSAKPITLLPISVSTERISGMLMAVVLRVILQGLQHARIPIDV
jgi:hypothetical protein